MKYVQQFLLIISVSFIGEILKAVLPFPIPASIYGLLIMLVALVTGVIKLDKVKGAADFLVDVMPVMFIPAAAGLLVSFTELKGIVIPVMVITFLSTILVMVVSGGVTQWVIRHDKKRKDKK